MKKLICLILSFISLLCEANDFKIDQEILNALKEVNKIRKEAGLDSVTISVNLSQGCYNHAKYLVVNRGNEKVEGLNAHKEFNTLKNYSPSGEIAGKNSVISYQKPFESVSAWIASFYHRVPLLQPNLKEIGIAYYEETGYWPISLINCISGLKGPADRDVVLYPENNQNNVPLKMGPEIPHPMGAQGNYGFPVTIFFAKWQKIANVKAVVTDLKGNSIKCNLSTPEKPATSFTQWNTICIIPYNPFQLNTTYKVSVSCTVDGTVFEKEFVFKTIAK